MIILLFLIYIFINNILFTKCHLPSFFSYWDEITALVLAFALIVAVYHRQKFRYKNNKYILFFTLLVIVVGILGNILSGYAFSLNSVIRDIVNFIKFPVSYVALSETGLSEKLYYEAKRHLGLFLKVFIVLVFVCGLISLVANTGMNQEEIRYGFHPYMFLFSHPTMLVISMVLAIATMDAIEEKDEYSVFCILAALNIILSFRTKGIAIAAAFLFIKYAGKLNRKLMFLYGGCAILIVIAVLYSKLSLYMTFTGSGRQSLYAGALQLMKENFPIGSGFATYGSYLSGKYYSGVYDFIFIPEVIFEGKNMNLNVLGDVGYPYYIGQFGALGCVLFMAAIACVARHVVIDKKHLNLGCLLVIVYILVALTAETTLLNYGIEMAVILSICAYKTSDCRQRIKEEG